jgi:hypothetical protein
MPVHGPSLVVVACISRLSSRQADVSNTLTQVASFVPYRIFPQDSCGLRCRRTVFSPWAWVFEDGWREVDDLRHVAGEGLSKKPVQSASRGGLPREEAGYKPAQKTNLSAICICRASLAAKIFPVVL